MLLLFKSTRKPVRDGENIVFSKSAGKRKHTIQPDEFKNTLYFKLASEKMTAENASDEKALQETGGL